MQHRDAKGTKDRPLQLKTPALQNCHNCGASAPEKQAPPRQLVSEFANYKP